MVKELKLYCLYDRAEVNRAVLSHKKDHLHRLSYEMSQKSMNFQKKEFIQKYDQ